MSSNYAGLESHGDVLYEKANEFEFQGQAVKHDIGMLITENDLNVTDNMDEEQFNDSGFVDDDGEERLNAPANGTSLDASCDSTKDMLFIVAGHSTSITSYANTAVRHTATASHSRQRHFLPSIIDPRATDAYCAVLEFENRMRRPVPDMLSSHAVYGTLEGYMRNLESHELLAFRLAPPAPVEENHAAKPASKERKTKRRKTRRH